MYSMGQEMQRKASAQRGQIIEKLDNFVIASKSTFICVVKAPLWKLVCRRQLCGSTSARGGSQIVVDCQLT